MIDENEIIDSTFLPCSSFKISPQFEILHSTNIHTRILNGNGSRHNKTIACNKRLKLKIIVERDDEDEDDDDEDDESSDEESDDDESSDEWDDDNDNDNVDPAKRAKRAKRAAKRAKRQAKLEAKAAKQIKVPIVHCPFFPNDENNPKQEIWFVLVGDKRLQKLLYVKRFTMNKLVKEFEIEVDLPTTNDNNNDKDKDKNLSRLIGSEYIYDVNLMSDSYMGVDLSTQVKFTIGEPEDESDDEDSDDDEEESSDDEDDDEEEDDDDDEDVN